MPKSRVNTTAVRFDAETHERLRKASEAFGLPINFLVGQAVREFLNNMIDPSEFTLTKAEPGAEGGQHE